MDDEIFISLLLKIVSSFFDDIYVRQVLSISWYGVISRKSSVLIIGGLCDGNLQNSRQQHRAIANDDRIYVVGGEGTL